MSRTIDVLSEPDSNSDHRNNVFAENFEPMTHPRTGGCYIPDNHQSDIKIMLKSYSMNQNHILVIWTWSPIVWTLMTSCIFSSETSRKYIHSLIFQKTNIIIEIQEMIFLIGERPKSEILVFKSFESFRINEDAWRPWNSKMVKTGNIKF